MSFALQLLFLVLQFVTFFAIGAAAAGVLIFFTPPRWIWGAALLVLCGAGVWIAAYADLLKGPF